MRTAITATGTSRQIAFDNANAASHFNPTELAADLADQVMLQNDHHIPLEVVDLHVLIDKNNVLSRHVRFRLHNRTNKRVTGYGFEIADSRNNGSVLVGTGAERDWIEAGGVSREWTEEYADRTYWCEGEAQTRIIIDNVLFQNGSEWNLPTDDPKAEHKQ